MLQEQSHGRKRTSDDDESGFDQASKKKVRKLYKRLENREMVKDEAAHIHKLENTVSEDTSFVLSIRRQQCNANGACHTCTVILVSVGKA